MSRELPQRPSLTQLKLQAKELQRAHAERKLPAAARIAAHHPEWKSQSAQAVLDREVKLADAQLVIAREYGFQNWAHLKHHVEAADRVAQYRAHPRFDDAVAAMDAGDIERLRELIASHPELVHARTNLEPRFGYFTGATLLHHTARNPGRPLPVPANLLAMARLLLDAGAAVDALTLGGSGGTTMGLVITSKQASDANLSGPLIDLLLERGAKLDLDQVESVIPDWKGMRPLDAPLMNHAPRAAEKMIELGAEADVLAAAALGRMDLLRDGFDAEGRLKARPRRGGKRLSERDAIGLALLFAYANDHSDAVDFLLDKDGNWNMTGVQNGAALHRAAWAGDLSMVKRLVAKGADLNNRDNPFNSTPISWAQHNKQAEVFDWLRANCRFDLHEAVALDLREQVEARLRENPASVNEVKDQWEGPRVSPLHWAVWPHIHDVDGAHALDFKHREGLVHLLLDHGADPNIIGGDGYTPLDWAIAGGAENIIALLKRHGAKRAGEL